MPIRVAALCGLAAPVAFVVGIFLGDLAQPDPFDPAHDDISHLGAQTASSPWLYNQIGANLTGLLVVCLGLGLGSALGPRVVRPASGAPVSWSSASAWCSTDSFDSTAGAGSTCPARTSRGTPRPTRSSRASRALHCCSPRSCSPSRSGRARAGARRGYRRCSRFRPSSPPSAVFGTIGQGAASRAGSVAWFVWIGFVAHHLWRATTPTGAPAADTVQA